MFPSFSVRASFMQEHGKIMFLVQFQCSNKFGSVRSALHQRVPSSATEAHLSRLEEPEWATSDRLSYEEQEGRAPFFNCSPSFGSFFFSFGYTFQVSFSMFADQQGNQNAGSITGWTPKLLHVAESQVLTMPPFVQERECKQANLGGQKGHVLETWKWGMGIDQRQATYWKRI